MKPTWLVGAVALAAYLWFRRRKLEPTFLVGGAIAVVGSLVYGLGLFEFPDLEKVLEDLGQSLGAWTYLLVGGLAFLETGAFIGLLAPGETTILVGGVVAGQGQIDIVALIALVWACAVAGDLTSFFLGRKLGRGFLEQHGGKVSITPERLLKVEGFFEKYGGRAILLGRFVGLVRAIAPFLAGSSGMPLRRFLPYDVIGAGLWGSAFCLLGYLFWQSFGTVLDYAKTGTLGLGTLIVVGVGIVTAVKYLRVPGNRAKVRASVERQERLPVVGPAIGWVLRRGERPARFAWARVTPGSLGLEFTTLLAILAVGTFAVAGYAISLGPGEITPTDARALTAVDDLRAGWLDDAAKLFTDLGLLPVTLAAVVVACGVLVAKREVLEAAAIGSGYALMLLAEELLRNAKDRARPAGGLVETTTPAFPSAHTAHAVAWVAIAVAVARARPGWGARTAIVVASVLVVLGVAATRVYLRVHWFSDVVGGAGLGAACWAACGIAALVVGHLRHAVRER